MIAVKLNDINWQVHPIETIRLIRIVGRVITVYYKNNEGGGYYVYTDQANVGNSDILTPAAFNQLKERILSAAQVPYSDVYPGNRPGPSKVRVDGEDVDALGGVGRPAGFINSTGE